MFLACLAESGGNDYTSNTSILIAMCADAFPMINNFETLIR